MQLWNKLLMFCDNYCEPNLSDTYNRSSGSPQVTEDNWLRPCQLLEN